MSPRPIDRRAFATLCLTWGTATLMSVGCSSMPTAKGWRDWLPGKKEPKPETPVRMAVMWTPDILSGAGHTTTRGFGGRIFFYNERGKPAMVLGDLTVHGFDENDPAGANNARRYRFTADNLHTHMSQNDLGLSYSFWLPWDAMGSEQKRITLITTFQPIEGGKPVQSEPAVVLLPGPHPEPPPTLPPKASLPPPATSIPPSPAAAAAMRGPQDGLQTLTIQR